MEPAASLPPMPFKKKLRAGQERAVAALSWCGNHLNVKLPTGYGKTFLACCIYSMRRAMGNANRMLYLVSNTSQLNQFERDAWMDLRDAGVDGPLKIMDLGFFGTAACLKAHRSGECQVFVITVQALIESRGYDLVSKLLETGQWMICVDEYHHYGVDKPWARSVLNLNRAFLLCMSATPERPGDDGAFGKPHIEITYREAAKEGAVKPLRGHSYNYRVDLEKDGESVSCTIKDLVDMVGSDSPDKIEAFRIERKMRWSPDYISPLVSHPIERMMGDRVATGYKLQVLIGAMCVSHAKLICEQTQEMFPELKIDWVGTGDHGRSDKDNERILELFCPRKNDDGTRPEPMLDVLVHVGIAGEGLDTVYVSESVALNGPSINNSEIQKVGRSARYLPGVTGHVNFDASSEFAEKGYVGDAIMDAMDYKPPQPEDSDEEDTDGDERDYTPLPDEPYIRIYSMELIEIDSGHEGVQRMARVLNEHDPGGFDYEAMFADQGHPQWHDLIRLYRGVRAAEANEFNEKSTVGQLRNSVDGALVKVTGLIIMKMRGNGAPIHKSLAGKIKHKINQQKKGFLGEVSNDKPVLNKHYKWLTQLERDILKIGVPSWLAHLSK